MVQQKAWGNKALFRKSSDTSSVGQYVKRKSKDDNKNEEINQNDRFLATLLADEIEIGISKFKKWLPNISHLIAPILNIAYDKQEDDGDVNFKTATTSKHGLWQSELCCDAMTRDFHTEKDITYTFISIPLQQNDNEIIFPFLFNKMTMK